MEDHGHRLRNKHLHRYQTWQIPQQGFASFSLQLKTKTDTRQNQ